MNVTVVLVFGYEQAAGTVTVTATFSEAPGSSTAVVPLVGPPLQPCVSL